MTKTMLSIKTIILSKPGSILVKLCLTLEKCCIMLRRNNFVILILTSASEESVFIHQQTIFLNAFTIVSISTSVLFLLSEMRIVPFARFSGRRIAFST